MKDVNIIANDLIKTVGSSDRLKIGLFDGNTPLSNYPVQIIINGRTYNHITESDGYTYLNINLPVGEYETIIKFNGDSEYSPVTKYVVVRILSNNVPIAESIVNDNYFEINGIPLFVKLNDGFTVKEGVNIHETAMLMETTTLNAPTFYYNSGDTGVEFDITIILKPNFRYRDGSVSDYLNMWNKNVTPVSVVTNAFDVPNGKYIMSIKDKKQNNFDFSVWKLHFHQFFENSLSFMNLYQNKVSTLSSDDIELLKHNIINEDSGFNAIYALQNKLKFYGKFKPFYPVNEADIVPRVPNGLWDNEMVQDIFQFQTVYMKTEKKQGICDKDTINALISNYKLIGAVREYSWGL